MEQDFENEKLLVEQLSEKLKESINVFEQKTEEANAEIIKFKILVEQLENVEANTQNSLNKINESFQNISEKENSINTKYNEIVASHEELYTSNGDYVSYMDDLKNLKILAADSNRDFGTKKVELDTYYEKVFGKTENDNTIKEGLSHVFDNKLNSLNEFSKNQDIKFKTLFDRIESLLSGATSVGLAKAYEDQKKSYSKPLMNWSGIFVATMIIMLSFGCYYFIEISKVEDLNLQKAIISLLSKLPFFIPTIWLALYASKKQSQYKRLQQEYAFKETFAKSYDGHKRQIEALVYEPNEQKKLMEELLSHLVKITSHNPSSTLDYQNHNDEPPLTKLMERILPNRNNSKKIEIPA